MIPLEELRARSLTQIVRTDGRFNDIKKDVGKKKRGRGMYRSLFVY